MREVLLDLATVDIIQTVKCTRRLDQFAKADKALSRRLQNRIFDLELCLDEYESCNKCEKSMMSLYLNANFREINDAVTRWKWNRRFNFWFEGGCKCDYIDGRMQEIEPRLLNHPSSLYDSHLLRAFEDGTDFVINSGSLDEAIVNCGTLFNIFTKFCVIHKFELRLYNNDDQIWEQMNAFFNANPPDLRIQPCVSIDSGINLNIFSTSSIFSNGLAKIQIYDFIKQWGLVDAYHEVLRRTPQVFLSVVDLPYTYEDLFGFFKDTKKLSLHSETHIAEEQLGQLVQDFYEVKRDEERTLEIKFDGDFLIKDFLTLIPEEAYSLQLKRSRIVGPEPEIRTWAEMTDKFGGRWALIVIVMNYHCRFLHIRNMNYFTEDCLSNLGDEFEINQFFDPSDSDQSDSEQFDSDQSYSGQSDFD
ncbi:hypothetical protein WR25_26306 isoform B [Diploscapter pachys]|uniref:F-box associated domain-containing protein n=1 Tax=Diploscapter pachys TaxID=2018661 RepID=A0A2A2JPQ2_9BILA|nr:hypothetical protein WR25_26306 isoform B [Diploscapter pachys]